MSDLVSFDDGDVRRSIQAERDTAAERREQGKPPTEYLASFLDNYGKVALPVKNALDDYYRERQRAFNTLAAQHEYMADKLGEFLNTMDHTDKDGASRVGNIFGDGPVGPGAGPSGSTPLVGSRNGSTPSDATPVSQPAAANGSNGSNGAELAGTPTGLAGPISSAATDGQPRTQGHTQQGETAPAAGPLPPAGGPPGGPPSGGGPSGGGPGPNVVVPPVVPPGPTPSVTGTPDGQVPGEPVAPMPVVPGAVPAGQRRAADRSRDVDAGVNEDLVLARTLLAAILAAVAAGGARQSTGGVDWAVSIMRGPGGPSVFVTTNEGRGWLPAGLFLPQEVSVPWLSEVADGAPAWEEIGDPARVLAEFAGAWGESSGAQLTALVSSTGIDDAVRALVGDSVGVEANVGPASSDLDLAVPGPGLVDRLTAVGGATGEVPDGQVLAQCVRLAADTHAQVVRTVGAGLERAVPDVAVARGLREQICTAVQAGREVPEQLWRDLWNADVRVEAALPGRRPRLGSVDVAEPRPDHDGLRRQLVFERRCNELVLLMGNGASQQTLRDVTYSHGQVLDHPQFGRAPVEARGDRPVVAAPDGAVAPSVSPPAATPWTESADDRAAPS